MKYQEHEVIEVHHQSGIRHFACKSFWDEALDGGLTIEEFHKKEKMQEVWGDDPMPESWERAAKTYGFPLVHVIDDAGNVDYWRSATAFDKEAAAIDYLASDLNQLIVIDSDEDALFYAEKYRGHEEAKVRAKAREIYKMHTDAMNYEIEKAGSDYHDMVIRIARDGQRIVDWSMCSDDYYGMYTDFSIWDSEEEAVQDFRESVRNDLLEQCPELPEEIIKDAIYDVENVLCGKIGDVWTQHEEEKND